MVWTQSVTRNRWLATKLAVIGVTTVAVVAAFALMFTWWSSPIDSTGSRIGTATFGSRGDNKRCGARSDPTGWRRLPRRSMRDR